MGSLGTADSAIPTRVADSFSHSIQQGYIHLYASDNEPQPFAAVTDDPPQFPQFGHVVHQLRDKPAVPPQTPDLSKRRDKDVLEGPEYGKGEKVLEMEQGGRTYSLVHNLHALFPEHMMAIPFFGNDDKDKDRSFRPQTSDLLPEDLFVAWRVVNAYAQAGRETVMFFNGGPLAGASQPHLHMQFCPFQYNSPPAPEALARSLSPLSTTSASSSSANEDFTPAPRLPLPWTQFYLPLPTSSTSSTAPLTPEALFSLYTRLLRTSREYIASIAASEASAASAQQAENCRRLPPSGPKRESYNLFLTSQHLHLVPRTDRLVAIERKGDDHELEDDLLRISLNGLVYLGYWHVPSREDWELVKGTGLAEVLQRAAYVNEQWRAPS
ncbi:hypothetical protein JCM10908_002191 [Rhodotorula pacifica]|uniref:uncharacterized protein n=1 Tax=Rhodotorula pacifica TaxID=1495444 RepID=UPI003170F628